MSPLSKCVCATADVIARIPSPPPDQYNLLFSGLTIRWHAVLAFGVHACTDATVTHLSTHHSLCRNNLVTIATQSAPHRWMDRSEQAPSLFSLSLSLDVCAKKPGWPRPLNTFRSDCSHAPVIRWIRILLIVVKSDKESMTTHLIYFNILLSQTFKCLLIPSSLVSETLTWAFTVVLLATQSVHL